MVATAILMGTAAAAASDDRRHASWFCRARSRILAGDAAMTGVIHVVLSILFTAIFTVVASAVATMTMGELLSTAGSLALAGILFGISLWLVNFYLIAPVAGVLLTEQFHEHVEQHALAVPTGLSEVVICPGEATRPRRHSAPA
jgi:Na+/H+-dicarboxylate symporter